MLRIKPWAFVRTGFVFEAKYHSGELKCKLLATYTRSTKHALDSPNVIKNTGGEGWLVFICIHAARLGVHRLSDRAVFIHGMVWTGLKWKITSCFSQDAGSPPTPPTPAALLYQDKPRSSGYTHHRHLLLKLRVGFIFLFCFGF